MKMKKIVVIIMFLIINLLMISSVYATPISQHECIAPPKEVIALAKELAEYKSGNYEMYICEGNGRSKTWYLIYKKRRLESIFRMSKLEWSLFF